MHPSFQIVALEAERFRPWFALDDAELARRGARRVVADETPGFPCRVSLVDAEPGETLLLLNYTHHDVATPYRASGPILVREAATASATLAPGEVPDMLRHRLLSVRAYDGSGFLVASFVVLGTALEHAIDRLFADTTVHEIHVHNAKPGCFNCRVVRARAVDLARRSDQEISDTWSSAGPSSSGVRAPASRRIPCTT